MAIIVKEHEALIAEDFLQAPLGAAKGQERPGDVSSGITHLVQQGDYGGGVEHIFFAHQLSGETPDYLPARPKVKYRAPFQPVVRCAAAIETLGAANSISSQGVKTIRDSLAFLRKQPRQPRVIRAKHHAPARLFAELLEFTANGLQTRKVIQMLFIDIQQQHMFGPELAQ